MHRLHLSLLSLLVLLPRAATAIPDTVVYTPERVARAHENIARHAWAEAERAAIFELADEASQQSAKDLATWFSVTTPTNQCSCPHCGAYWLNYIWDWNPAHPDQISCNRCNTLVTPDRYPENRTIYREDPQGQRIPHPVHEDADGSIFPVRQAIAYYKANHAYDWIEALGAAYVLSGDERFAKTAGSLLERLATVYPGYAWHDNFRFEPKAWGWAGKLTGWHLNDAQILMQCGTTYDAIRRSPQLSGAQRTLIEEQLFRLGGRMLTSVRPLQGISNDVAFRYGAVALIGRLLDDRGILAWVLDGDESYAAIVDKLFYRDGAWHERTPSYHNMLTRSLYYAPYYLDGYRDPLTATPVQLRALPKFQTIHSLLFRMRFPDGSLPAINDSRFGTRIAPEGIEALYSFFPDDAWLARLQAAYDGALVAQGSRFALFNRPPDIAERLEGLSHEELIPTESEDFSGMGLFMLRRGDANHRTVFTMHHHKFANSHTHYDALSTMLHAEGREMLSDLGYALFGIRERSTWYMASLSHNTLTVDTQNQRAPNGVANFLHHGALFSACEGESWDSYRFICEPFTRQIALVDTDGGRPYALDIFRGGGGQVHDYALHGEGSELAVEGVNLTATDSFPGKDYAYQEVHSVRASPPNDGPWRATWRWEDGAVLTAHVAAQEDTQAIVTRSPGMRTRDQQGREIHSLFQRREGKELRSEFVTVFDPHSGDAVVKSVEKLLVTPGTDWALVLKVELEDATDYIFSSYLNLAPMEATFAIGEIEVRWESRFGIVRIQDGKLVRSEWVHAPMEGLAHDL